MFDKIIEELEEQKLGLTTWGEDTAYKLAIEDAIRVVKKYEVAQMEFTEKPKKEEILKEIIKLIEELGKLEN